jgi:hypothetical protein
LCDGRAEENGTARRFAQRCGRHGTFPWGGSPSGIIEGEATGVSAKTEDYTLGVEEEYQIIDPETHALSPSGEAVLQRAQQTLG